MQRRFKVFRSFHFGRSFIFLRTYNFLCASFMKDTTSWKSKFGIIYHRVVWPLHGWTDLISWLASLVPMERQNSLLKMLHFKSLITEVYGPSRGERVKIIVRCKTYLIRFKVRVVNNYVTCVSVSCHNICAIKFVFIFLDRNTNTNISWIFPNKLREMACLLSSFFRIKFVFWIADFTIPRM